MMINTKWHHIVTVGIRLNPPNDLGSSQSLTLVLLDFKTADKGPGGYAEFLKGGFALCKCLELINVH